MGTYATDKSLNCGGAGRLTNRGPGMNHEVFEDIEVSTTTSCSARRLRAIFRNAPHLHNATWPCSLDEGRSCRATRRGYKKRPRRRRANGRRRHDSGHATIGDRRRQTEGKGDGREGGHGRRKVKFGEMAPTFGGVFLTFGEIRLDEFGRTVLGVGRKGPKSGRSEAKLAPC